MTMSYLYDYIRNFLVLLAAVTLKTLKDPKHVVDKALVRGQYWYLQRSIEQESVIVKDMMKV